MPRAYLSSKLRFVEERYERDQDLLLTVRLATKH
jgi:hypothetical protein